MSIRRSKRRLTTQLSENDETVDSPIQKKKTLSLFDAVEVNENRSSGRTRSNRPVKSKYFESPNESEESSSDPDSAFTDSKPKIKPKVNNNFQPCKMSLLEMASKADESQCPQEQAKLNEFLMKNLTQNFKGYESESSSSSDVDIPKQQPEINKSVIPTVDEIMEETSVNCKPLEFFDFTPLLSQVTQPVSENEGDVENVESKPKPSVEKKFKRGKKESKVRPKEEMEVFELLAMGEKIDMSAKDIEKRVSNVKPEYEIPQQVEIQLDGPVPKKKKTCNDLEMALRRRLNNIRREMQIYVHKVHALCWIAHGNHINEILNSPHLLGAALSLLPSEKCYPPKRMNLEYLEDLISWFTKKLKLKKDPSDENRIDFVLSLRTQIEKLEAETKSDLCFLFICILRALGIKCRLIINLNVAPIKPISDHLLPITQKKEENEKLGANTSKVKSEKKEKSTKNNRKSSSKTSEKVSSESKKEDNKSEKCTKNDKENDTKAWRRSSRLMNKSKYFEDEGSEEEEPTISVRRSTSRKKKFKVKPDSDEEPLVGEMSTSGSDGSDTELRTPKKKKLDRKVLSPDIKDESQIADTKTNKTQIKVNYWIEVYLEAEEKWTSVDVAKKSLLCDEELYKSAAHPVRYILAWNNDQSIKDVTRRYVPNYLTVTRKLRADESWWKSTLFPFRPLCTAQDKEEDEELEKKLEQMPLPTSINEYKNHPYYVLKRHLLKFQAIYPSDAPTLGFIKGEPVYSRLCVQQLHGREMWIKEAKVVKLNEKPYKIVKGRLKKEKFGASGEGPRDIELFGIWQVEDYIPPTAENGKVPRNAFGNVELFKSSMLPIGTVYLQLPGLLKIANKLNIDCAVAITGFEYSTNGWSYPVKDGFVVCEEFKDILLDAYNQELAEAEKKERLKREERVYANWRSLIKSLIIAEKLKRKYNFGEPKTSKGDTTKKK